MTDTLARTLLAIDDEDGNLDVYTRFLRTRLIVPGGPLDPPRSSRRSGAETPVRPPPAAFRLLLAHSGEEAIAVVARELAGGRVVDGAFCDMRMPGGIDGLETIGRLHVLDPFMIFTMVTGHHAYSAERIAGTFGADPTYRWCFCKKPFKPEEIQQRAEWMTRTRREVAHPPSSYPSAGRAGAVIPSGGRESP